MRFQDCKISAFGPTGAIQEAIATVNSVLPSLRNALGPAGTSHNGVREVAGLPMGHSPPEVDREWKKAGMVVGIDTHDQMRYDKKPKGMTTDEEMNQWLDERGICRSRYLKGTDLRTTFATISCITKRSSFFLGVIRKKREDEMSDLVRRLVGKCNDLGIRVGLVMLDRGFYATGVIHSLKEIRAEKKKQDPGSPFDHLIQCRRTKRVKDTLDEYAEMGVAASEGVITGKTSKSDGKSVPVSYYLCIVKSKAHEARERRNERKKGGRKKGRTNRCGRCGQKRPETPPGSDPDIHPGCKFTGFACGMLDTDASKYAERWMNETRYRVLEEQMPRTRNTAKAVPVRRHSGNPAQPCDNREHGAACLVPERDRDQAAHARHSSIPVHPGPQKPARKVAEGTGSNTGCGRVGLRVVARASTSKQPLPRQLRPQSTIRPVIARCDTRPPVRPAVKPTPYHTPTCRPSAPPLAAELMPIRYSKPDSPLYRDAC